MTDATYTRCDSCSDTWFDCDGNTTHEHPHLSDINSEPGVCPECATTLRNLGFSDERIFGTILSGGDTRIESRSPQCNTVRTEAGPSTAQFTLLTAPRDQQNAGANLNRVGCGNLERIA